MRILKFITFNFFSLVAICVQAQSDVGYGLKDCSEFAKGVQEKNRIQEFYCEPGFEKSAAFVSVLRGPNGSIVSLGMPKLDIQKQQCVKPYVKELTKKYDIKYIYGDGEVAISERICISL
jgi:hypothetical protein